MREEVARVISCFRLSALYNTLACLYPRSASVQLTGYVSDTVSAGGSPLGAKKAPNRSKNVL